LQAAKASGVAFTSASNLWFAEHPTARTICVSGTMGKSTTAALIAHLLQAAGVATCLAGNIGRPMLACADAAVDWWVIELSSYQLADLNARPDIAVLLNLTEEHVDWHGSVARYHQDKLRLASLVAAGGLIANHADALLTARLAGYPDVRWFNHASGWSVQADGVAWQQDRLIPVPAVLAGRHNRHNLAAALTVVERLGFEVPALEKTLSGFKNLSHRLQLLGEKEGIRYVDDSISTTPVSVAAALETMGRDDVVLLLGGLDRGLDWREFATGIAAEPPFAIITLPDNGPVILQQMEKAAVKPPGGLHAAACLSEAVILARALVPDDGCILLSPGAPSFPHFRDYEDRGQQFADCAGIENTQ